MRRGPLIGGGGSFERHGLSAQQPLHDGLDRRGAGPQQQMEVVGDQRPSVTSGWGAGAAGSRPSLNRADLISVCPKKASI